MMLRMLLLVPLFIFAFADGIQRPEEVQLAYSLVLRLLVCLILFAAGNVVKTLLAKLLASHVHRQAFFDKMQDALQKVSLSNSAHWTPLHANELDSKADLKEVFKTIFEFF